MLCISKRNQHSLSSSSQHFIIHSLQAWCKGMKAKVSLEVFDKSICMLIDWSNEGGVNSSRLVSTLPDSIFYLKKTKIYLQIFCSLMKDLNLQNVKEARVSHTNLFEAHLNFWISYFDHEKSSQAANAVTQYFLFLYFLKRLAHTPPPRPAPPPEIIIQHPQSAEKLPNQHQEIQLSHQWPLSAKITVLILELFNVSEDVDYCVAMTTNWNFEELIYHTY